jgi:hypothetical protein
VVLGGGLLVGGLGSRFEGDEVGFLLYLWDGV